MQVYLQLFVFREYPNINLKLVLKLPFVYPSLRQCKQSPLHLAAKSGHADICRLLVENNAKLDLQDNVSLSNLERSQYFFKDKEEWKT